MFKFVDLFAGIGGFRIASENNGGKCVYSSEWDKHSKKTYFANFGEMPNGDITKIDIKEIPNHDLVCAGFPCQPFSLMGKRQGFSHATQGDLFFEIVRVIEHHKTKMILLENVKGLVSHDNGKTLETILFTLEQKLGYHIFHRILDSSDYGLPQKRKRIYIVGFLKESYPYSINYTWPLISKNKHYIGEYIEDHPCGYNITPHLQKNYLFKKDDGKPQIVDKKSNVFVNTFSASYFKIQRLTGTFVRNGDTGIRRFSKNECIAIMGFPKNFIVPVSRAQMYRQFGNSLTVPVADKIIAQMLKVSMKAND